MVDVSSLYLNFLREIWSLLKLVVNDLGSFLFGCKVLIDLIRFRDFIYVVAKLFKVLYFVATQSFSFANEVYAECFEGVFFS